MAVLGQKLITLVDWAKRLDPDGKTSAIAELLNQTNEILDDMPFVSGNLPTGHRTTIRTGLPNVYWRLLNKGVPNSKSRTAQVDEATGMLEARGAVDTDLAMLNGNTNEFRLSEATPFFEAMNQEMASTIFYGNSSSSPEEFNGLSVRYSDSTAEIGQNIIKGGGSQSDNTSIWLVGWGENSIHGIFPKGSKAGIIHEDLGVGDEFDADGNRYRAYMDRWQWKCGIALRDWRYAVRIPNIDVSDLVGEENDASALTKLMIKAIHRIPYINMCKPVFYMNRTVFQMLDIQRRADMISGGGLTYQVVDGKEIPMFRGIPIKKTDAILENEALVS